MLYGYTPPNRFFNLSELDTNCRVTRKGKYGHRIANNSHSATWPSLAVRRCHIDFAWCCEPRARASSGPYSRRCDGTNLLRKIPKVPHFPGTNKFSPESLMATTNPIGESMYDAGFASS